MFNNMLDGVDKIIADIEQIDAEVGKEMLRSTLVDFPRPAFDTGTLRRSGRAYVNGRLVSSTHRMREAQGRNPATASRNRTPLATKDFGKDTGVGFKASGATFNPMKRGVIEIVYKAPYASKMHDWQGNFTDPESGPGFISAKMMKLGNILRHHVRRIL